MAAKLIKCFPQHILCKAQLLQYVQIQEGANIIVLPMIVVGCQPLMLSRRDHICMALAGVSTEVDKAGDLSCLSLLG